MCLRLGLFLCFDASTKPPTPQRKLLHIGGVKKRLLLPIFALVATSCAPQVTATGKTFNNFVATTIRIPTLFNKNSMQEDSRCSKFATYTENLAARYSYESLGIRGFESGTNTIKATSVIKDNMQNISKLNVKLLAPWGDISAGGTTYNTSLWEFERVREGVPIIFFGVLQPDSENVVICTASFLRR